MADKDKEEKKPKAGAAAPTKEQLEASQALKAAKKAAADKNKVAKVEGGEQVPFVTLRLKDKYQKDVIPALMEKFSMKNKFAVPRVTKVCLNMGFGKAATDNNPKVGEQCVADMMVITGQKAVVTLSKKAVSNFKLRENMQIGCRVTLRGPKMYEFLDRLFMQEQSVFPEIDGDKIDIIHGMDITICTTAKKDEHARELLKGLGCPFRDH
jgi:large subunit ribosomal protein L5